MGCRFLPLAVVLVAGALCTSAERMHWWQNSIIYQIYPSSFYDSNGDGYGDLNGIEAKVDYLKELGVGAVWLNPIYKSPFKDGGYDVTNHMEIDPRFGTMKDFERMMESFESQRIELMLDFVPNHTSDQHPWFQNSIQMKDSYSNFYIWEDPKRWDGDKPIPPNNWVSIFNQGTPGSAWEWNEERQQFYYHSFMVEQPDLNLRNRYVVQALKEILLFWMKKGVTGFRLDAAPHLFEDDELQDEPKGEHIYTRNLPENYEFVQDIRRYIDEYGRSNGLDMCLTVEAYTGNEETMRYYGDPDKPGANFPFNFKLLTDVNSETDAPSLNHTVVGYLSSLKKHQFPNWVSGNHDWPRIPSRMGASSAVDVINILNLLLPGTSTLYMGDEIGMDSYWNIDKNNCPAEIRDDYRTPNRTPFLWSDDLNAGFTTSRKPWIPISPEYYHLNAEQQTESFEKECETSHLKNFKLLSSLKSSPAFNNGKFSSYVLNDQVWAFTRESRYRIYLALINLSKVFADPFEVTWKIPAAKQKYAINVEMRSVNLVRDCPDSEACLDKVFSGDWRMPPKSGLVVSFKKETPKKPKKKPDSKQKSPLSRLSNVGDVDTGPIKMKEKLSFRNQ